MKTHYSILELLEMKLENLPTTKMGLGSKVVRESWPFIEVAGKGGKGGKRREYAPPPEVLKLIQAKKLNEVLGGLSDLPSPQPSPQPSPTGRGGEGGAPSKLRQGVAALGEWAGNDWAKREIAAGFALLAALNLPNRPAAQDLPVVAEIWYRKLKEAKEIVSPEYDPIRIQTGFKVLQQSETWPHPAELLRNLPPRLIPRAMLAKPAPDKEKGRQKMAEVKDVLNKKGK